MLAVAAHFLIGEADHARTQGQVRRHQLRRIVFAFHDIAVAIRLHHYVAADPDVARSHRDNATLIRLMNQAANDRTVGRITVVVPMQRVPAGAIELTHAAELNAGEAADRMARGVLRGARDQAIRADAVAL